MSRVLVVEDDLDIRELVASVLAEHGHEVASAGDGREALGLLSAFAADVILLDMRMPVLDGWAFAREYAAQPGPHARIVVCTAARDASSSAASIRADAWLAKPFDLAELLQAVARQAG